MFCAVRFVSSNCLLLLGCMLYGSRVIPTENIKDMEFRDKNQILPMESLLELDLMGNNECIILFISISSLSSHRPINDPVTNNDDSAALQCQFSKDPDSQFFCFWRELWNRGSSSKIFLHT